MRWRRYTKWQLREGGELVEAKGSHPWYHLVQFGWVQKRHVCLSKHPVCQLCERKAATIVDHIRPFISPEGIVSWALFSDPENHRALCQSCHSTLTAKYDSGFGNPKKAGKESHTMPTGAGGKQFSSGSVGSAALDKALDFDVNDLLSGIPE